MKLVAVVVVIGLATPAAAQEKKIFAETMMEAYEKGRAQRREREAHEASIELAAARRQLLRAETDAVRQQIANTDAATAKRQQDETNKQIAFRETEIAIGVLTVLHPDWKTYEPQMVALGSKMVAAPGVTAVEYLRLLYGLSSALAACPALPPQPKPDPSVLNIERQN